MSSIVNKVKDALHSDKSHEAPQGSHGPHTSHAANTVDPRVDSDRDHRANPASSVGGTAAGATTGTGSTVTGYNDPEGVHGPHSSRVGNAVDPRVDSDRDNRAAGIGGGAGTAHAGTLGSSSTGAPGVAAAVGNPNVATGYNDPTGTHGPHSGRVANAADPRVDSDRDHRAAPGGAGTAFVGSSGPGPAPNTAGPHRSDVLNKADPRVDSDLDNSRTVGGDKTFQQ